MKFVLERAHEFGQTGAESGDAHALDSFLPSILIIGRDGINFFEQHLRREKSSGYRQLGAAIAAQDAVAHDRRRQSLSGDACQHRWPTVGQKRNCRERRAEHNTRAEAEIFRERFVLANDAEPTESRVSNPRLSTSVEDRNPDFSSAITLKFTPRLRWAALSTLVRQAIPEPK